MKKIKENKTLHHFCIFGGQFWRRNIGAHKFLVLFCSKITKLFFLQLEYQFGFFDNWKTGFRKDFFLSGLLLLECSDLVLNERKGNSRKQAIQNPQCCLDVQRGFLEVSAHTPHRGMGAERAGLCATPGHTRRPGASRWHTRWGVRGWEEVSRGWEGSEQHQGVI